MFTALSSQEALDIDTFADLQLARLMMHDPKVAFYVNGNHQRGLGHIYRALELADEMNSKPDIYYDTLQTHRISLVRRLITPHWCSWTLRFI